MKLVFDIEGNGLLPELTDIWMLVIKDRETQTIYKFSDYTPALPSMKDGLDMLSKADVLIGHNVFGYDLPALHKIYGWVLPFDMKVHDTWILSMLNRYKRKHRHGLEGWGEHLGFQKGNFSDWSAYSNEMLRYCVNDVMLNDKVYDVLLREAAALIKRNPLYSKRIEVEMYIARLNAQLNQKGWVFDWELSHKTMKEINKRMDKTARRVEPKLGNKIIYKDKLPKLPKYTKKGWYAATTARMLTEHLGRTVTPENALDDNPPWPVGKEFQRFSEVPIEMGNMGDVKDYLMKNGWKPDVWNFSKVNGRLIKTSPKLEGESMKDLGDEGKGIKEYYMLRHRRSAIEGLQKAAEARGDGRISGNMWTIGTPSFRVRHEVIVNLPSTEAEYGTEIRSLFTCEDGYKVVGADSAGNQLRGFCHVVNNPEYTDKIINSDAHQVHADQLGISRAFAKVFIYRILFGSTGFGLAKALGIKEAEGNKIIEDYKKALPEFEKVVNEFRHQWKSNGGWVFGHSGNILFVEQEKDILNYYLQDMEKFTCSAAVYWSHQKLLEEGIDFYPTIFYHDEDAFVVREDQAERAGQIIRDGFKEGPKMFNVTIMDGGKACIGDSYADVH
jgi:DNA polymerase-1